MAGLGHWYVEIKKQGFWRGVQHTWENRYVMSGSDPNSGDADSVIAALKDIEDHVYPAVPAGDGVGFVEGNAYASTGGPPFASVGYNVGANPATSTGFTGPTPAYTSLVYTGVLESCLDTRTRLNGLNSRGKPIYLRKFIRGIGLTNPSGAAEPNPVIAAADVTKAEAFILPWQTGMGANSWVVIGVSGKQAAAAPIVNNFVGNHQVPRGRKRKVASGPGFLLSAAEKALLTGAGYVLENA